MGLDNRRSDHSGHGYGRRSDNSGHRGGNRFGGFRSNQGNRSFGSEQRELHKATCSDCGNACEVPFKPTEGKPVYCKECYTKHKPKRFY